MGSTAAYIRVSTKKQDLRAQQGAIKRAAKARGHSIRVWYAEKESGSTLNRPQLKRLREAVRSGAIRRIYVFALDRLSRSGIRDTVDVIQELNRYGCELVTVLEGFDFAGPVGELMAAAMAWCAQMEVRRLRERIQAARARVEAAGGRWGRPRRIDPSTLARARKLQKQGRTLRELAQALRVPRSTLSDALSGRGHYATGTQRRSAAQ